MNEQWGVTPYGFNRPGYDTILESLQRRANELFGTDLNYSVRTFTGLFIRLLAWFGSIVFQIAEGVYNSGFIMTASGYSLYNLGRMIGIAPLSEQSAVGTITVYGAAGTIVPAGFIVSTQSNIRFLTIERADIPESGKIDVAVKAAQAGLTGNVPAESIKKIVTPPAGGGITAVINNEHTTGGRNRETESEFRDRYLASVDLPGGSNTDAIRAELLRVESVLDATVFENTTDHYDAAGLPPHSIEAIVQGGLDRDIAQAIYDRKAAGIQTHGNVQNWVTDLSGIDKEILFSRPEPVEIWVRITGLQTVSPAPVDIVDNIKSAIIHHIGGFDAEGNAVSGLGIGEKVILNMVVCPVNQVEGVVDYLLELSKDGTNYGRDNIAIGNREVAQVTPDRIQVSV